MQKTKLLVLSVLAALLVSSALSVAAAQETPTATPTSPDVTSTMVPEQRQGTPVEGNQSAPGVGDLAPIYEHDGEPAFGVPANEDDSALTGAEPAQLYAENSAGNSSQDYTWIAAVIGVVLAVAIGGVIGAVYFRKARAEN